MKITYEKTHIIPYYLTNSFGELSLDGLFNLHQEMLTEYFSTFNMDNFNMKEKYNSAWVFTKVSANIIKTPKWKEEIHLHSEITLVKLAKVYTETIVKDDSGNVCAYLYCECCVIDLVKRRIVKLTDVSFPSMDVSNIEPKFLSYQDSISLNLVERKVSYTDIDFTNHTNNVSYIRYILDILNEEFLSSNIIKTISISYKAETKLNDNLDIYYYNDDSRYDFKIVDNDKISTELVIEYNNK